MNTLVILTLVFGAPGNYSTCPAAALCNDDRSQCSVVVVDECEMTLSECLDASAFELDWTGRYGTELYTVYGCENTRNPKSLDAGKD